MQSVDTIAVSSTLAGTSLKNHLETVQSHRSTSAPHPQSQFPQSSFVGVGPLFSRGRQNEVSPSMNIPSETDSPGPSPSPSASPIERPPVPTATGNILSRHQSDRTHLRRQSSLRSLALPTTPQTPETTTDILQQRRESHEDIDARRGSTLFIHCSLLIIIAALETIEGDSLSTENMEAYINILRSYGALGR